MTVTKQPTYAQLLKRFMDLTNAVREVLDAPSEHEQNQRIRKLDDLWEEQDELREKEGTW